MKRSRVQNRLERSDAVSAAPRGTKGADPRQSRTKSGILDRIHASGFGSGCLFVATLVLSGLPATAQTPRNYVFFEFDRHRIQEPSFLEHPAIEGAQLKYSWRELEPRPGEYDFSSIVADLEFLESRGKRLFIQLQEVSFVPTIVNVPQYLLDDPVYGGGAELMYESGDDGTEPVPEGWVARRWDPQVRKRFEQLLDELAKMFDGRIEGINLPETSIGFGAPDRYPADFSASGYRDGIVEIMSMARSAFATSAVIIYANFMPGESLPENDKGYLKSVYAHAESSGIGVGGPDLLPNRWYQQQHSLPLIRGRAQGTMAGIAVQFGNYGDVHRRTGHAITVPELHGYARDDLHVDYLFWSTEEPFYSRDVLPYLRKLAER